MKTKKRIECILEEAGKAKVGKKTTRHAEIHDRSAERSKAPVFRVITGGRV